MALTYEDIRDEFQKRCVNDKRADALFNQIASGKATYQTVSEYSVRVGNILADIFRQNAPLDDISEWDLEDLIPKSLGMNHRLVSKCCEMVQDQMNKDAKLGIRYQEPVFNSDRAYGLVGELKNAESFSDVEARFYDQVTNFTQNIVDEAIQANARVLNNAGVKAYVIRHAEYKACEWCKDLEGSYDYWEVRNTGNDVWRRHEGCRCTIDFRCEKNSGSYTERVNNYKKK